MREDYVYKICTKKEWDDFKYIKSWNGTEKDIKDGFIHLSKKDQVKQTLNRYFLKQKDLILLVLKTENLNNLIWEKSTDGDRFPHLYSNLELDNIIASKRLVTNISSRILVFLILSRKPDNFAVTYII